MIIDNLSITGLIAASLYLLMPLMMGRELIRVESDETPRPQPHRKLPLQSLPQPQRPA
jgi:hypothetical protein